MNNYNLIDSEREFLFWVGWKQCGMIRDDGANINELSDRQLIVLVDMALTRVLDKSFVKFVWEDIYVELSPTAIKMLKNHMNGV